MRPELEIHRRALLSAYQRYLAADRAWRRAQNEAVSWFPARNRPSVLPIGDPGSPLRRLHDRRDIAIVRLEVLQMKLHETRRRTTRHFRILALPPG